MKKWKIHTIVYLELLEESYNSSLELEVDIMSKIVLHQTGRYKFDYNSYTSRWIPAKGEIVMSHEGRYITMKKADDEKKDFRYDLVTGELERVNHYKKGDKFTRTQAKNITSWFTDYNLVTNDEKFAILYKYAERRTRHNYTSPVRFINL